MQGELVVTKRLPRCAASRRRSASRSQPSITSSAGMVRRPSCPPRTPSARSRPRPHARSRQYDGCIALFDQRAGNGVAARIRRNRLLIGARGHRTPAIGVLWRMKWMTARREQASSVRQRAAMPTHGSGSPVRARRRTATAMGRKITAIRSAVTSMRNRCQWPCANAETTCSPDATAPPTGMADSQRLSDESGCSRTTFFLVGPPGLEPGTKGL